MKRMSLGILAIFFVVISGNALAWSSNGHQMVGAIADVNLKGCNAEKHVHEILGETGGRQLTLEQVAVWPDCVRGIQPDRGFIYDPGHYRDAACKIFEDDAGKQEMADYARRNNSNCEYSGKASECHKAFHFADVDIEHNDYREGYVGTNDHDVVHAIRASIVVLKGGSAPAPFNIKDQKEALILLAHFIGDLHQPLHVGAIYLDPQGEEVDPENGFDPDTDTRGGNSITGVGGNLHGQWDKTNFSLSLSAPGCNTAPLPAKCKYTITSMAGKAKVVVRPKGDMDTWPAIWAGETVLAAKKAYNGISYSQEEGDRWPMEFDDRKAYVVMKNNLQYQQVIKAGARLTQILKAIWPDVGN